ncbi:MAG TPA: AI-2E family transporter, partial [Firmicutes bacterium]|nr:AI-2E family transporter [Bacillota bacterium]
MSGQDRERARLALRNAVAVLLVTLAGVYLAKVLFPFLLGAVAAVLLDPVVTAAAR